jgi:hypothetical protein
MSKHAWIHEFADSTPQWHAMAIPGIKLSDLVYFLRERFHDRVISRILDDLELDILGPYTMFLA